MKFNAVRDIEHFFFWFSFALLAFLRADQNEGDDGGGDEDEDEDGDDGDDDDDSEEAGGLALRRTWFSTHTFAPLAGSSLRDTSVGCGALSMEHTVAWSTITSPHGTR